MESTVERRAKIDDNDEYWGLLHDDLKDYKRLLTDENLAYFERFQGLPEVMCLEFRYLMHSYGIGKHRDQYPTERVLSDISEVILDAHDPQDEIDPIISELEFAEVGIEDLADSYESILIDENIDEAIRVARGLARIWMLRIAIVTEEIHGHIFEDFSLGTWLNGIKGKELPIEVAERNAVKYLHYVDSLLSIQTSEMYEDQMILEGVA